jgi:2,6-dihydroxypyridine 3-monooxygenase
MAGKGGRGPAGEPSRVVIAGGSLGGLHAALCLRDAGCDVQVFERSAQELASRGAGIVLQPATVRYFETHGLVRVEDISVPSTWLRYLDRDGSVLYEEASTFRFTAWNTLYRSFLEQFGRDGYHLGEALTAFEQDGDGVTVRFASGRRERCDLLVCADGIASTGRRLLLPEVEPAYAGYVGWRGLVEEREAPRDVFDQFSDAFTYFQMPDSQILAYPVPAPDGEITPGRRLVNWVWYRNVAEGEALDALMTDRHGQPRPASMPPGYVQDRFVAELRRTAERRLPPVFARLVGDTSEPFIQPIVDVEVQRMAFGRVCLIGDAAFAARPHAAAGTAKAAANGWALAEALADAGHDVPAALRRWEPAERSLGRELVRRAREMGDKSQRYGTWKPGDPALKLGLLPGATRPGAPASGRT